MIYIYEVPLVGWSIFEKVLFEQLPISISFKATATFRKADVVYFLFNPPNATEHPNNEAFRTKFERWLPEYSGISKESTAKILEVSNTLTLWETGGQSAFSEMSEEQIGHLRVFHPLYPEPYWNTPARCQESPVRNKSESFCRWRTLTQISLIHPRNIIGGQKPDVDTIITQYRGQGKGYGEILAIAAAIMAGKAMP